MKKSISFAALFAVSLLLHSCTPAYCPAQAVKPPQIAIAPSAPVAVPAGGSFQFNASGNGPFTWSLSGPGALDQTGHYAAPPLVRAQNQSHGCQVLPNNSPFNIPVDQLPVNPHSARWIQRIAGYQPTNPLDHSVKFAVGVQGLVFYDNPVDATTPQQTMNFLYLDRSNGYQGAPFPIPSPRALLMESGFSLDATANVDRHLFTTNVVDCTTTEIYNLYFDFKTAVLAANPSITPTAPTSLTYTTNTGWKMPQLYQVYIAGCTGAWAAANGAWRVTPTGANAGTLPIASSSAWGPESASCTVSSTQNGCPSCNSGGGQKFSPASYAMLGGVDAASMPIGALSLKLEEWYAATRAGRSDLGHALRTTLPNFDLSARKTWPAAGFANTQFLITNCVPSNGASLCTSLSDLSLYGSGPCSDYTYTPGCQFNIAMYGIPGPWGALDGDRLATAVDAFHFSVPVNSSGLGSYPNPCGTYSAPCYMVQDWIRYGDTIRYSAALDVDAYLEAAGCTVAQLADFATPSACALAKVWLLNQKKFGSVVADGTYPADTWDTSVISSEFHPPVLGEAALLLGAATRAHSLEPYMEVVDRSSQQLSSNLGSYLMTPVGRVTVKVCGPGGACASNDVLLQGTTIGTDRERVAIVCGASYPLNVWIHGNANPAMAFAIDGGIPGAAVSASGVVAMPACTTKQHGMVTITSVADAAALPHYVEVEGIPRGSDGGIRLALGNYTGDYLDAAGKNWTGAFANNGFNNSLESPAMPFNTQNGTVPVGSCSNDTWTGVDSQLFSRSTDQGEDTRVEVAGLPNGNYNLTLYAEPGFGGFGANNTCPNSAGQNVWDWWVIGPGTTQSNFDCFTHNGGHPFVGCTLTAQATVTDGVLTTIGRIRVPSVYGMSWSSLLIKPAPGPNIGPSLIHRVLNRLGVAMKSVVSNQ